MGIGRPRWVTDEQLKHCKICGSDLSNSTQYGSDRNARSRVCKQCRRKQSINNALKKDFNCRKCGVGLDEYNCWPSVLTAVNPNKICRSCDADYRYEQYNSPNSRFKQRLKKRQMEIKLDVIRHYSIGIMKCIGLNGNPCSSNCSDIRCLSIDHINGGGCKHRRELGKKSIHFYRWLIRNNFPAGFTVLCMNCQFIKREENGELSIKSECALHK